MVPMHEGNDAIVTMAKMPVHQWWWCHCDKGEDTSLTTPLMPSHQGQQQYFDNGKDAWTAKMPAHQWRQHRCNEGNNLSLTTAKTPVHWWQQQPHSYKGNNISLMTKLAWLWQSHHCNKGNNCHCNGGKDACTSMATTPSRGTIAIATTVKTPAHQQQWYHHNKGDNTSFTMSWEQQG
jgi:hypothetical protein